MLPLSRRTALQLSGTAVGVGFAGCLSSVPRSTPSATPPEPPTSGYWRWVTITESEQPPAEHNVGIEMEVIDPWIIAEGTARIEVTLANNLDQPQELGPVVDGPDFPANNTKGILLRDETDSSESHATQCIEGDGKSDEEAGYSGASRLPHKVGAKETTTREIRIFDDPNVRGCIPPGVYLFEIDHTVKPRGGTSGGQTYTWRFSLGIQGNDN